MTDGQILFAVFAAFYLIECLWLVHARAWITAGDQGTTWRFLRPFDRFQVSGGAPVLLSPLPPQKAHLLALPWLLVPGDTTLAVQQANGTTKLLPWEALEPRTEDHLLHLDANTTVRTLNKYAAETWADTLKAWKLKSPEKRRAAFLKHARDSLDGGKAGQLIEQASQRTRVLRVLGELIFFWCFGTITIFYKWFGENPKTYAIVAVLPLLTLAQAWTFLRVTRKHQLDIPHRRWRALGMVFLPHLAMRAADLVLITQTHVPHPLAFREHLKKDVFITAARGFWRSARYVPGWKTADPLPVEAEALEQFFRAHEVPPSEYDPAPQIGDQAVAWCPCCHAPFLKADTTCQDCGGVELMICGGT
jgi:hypothetical protein